MIRTTTFASALMAVLLAATNASAATVTTLYADFESPTFSIGDISNDPNATGQGGWGGWNAILDPTGACCLRARITGERAFSGTQSMRTTSDTRTINKALDAAGTLPYNPGSGGEYPFHSGGFTINAAYDWWVQAQVWINPGATVLMTLVNGLGGCPLIQISSTAVPYVNSCMTHDPAQLTLGDGAFGQWLTLEMVHTTTMFQTLEFRVRGAGIDRTMTLQPYSGPGSGSPVYLGLSGDAFWDNVGAGYGEAPAPVPLPGAAWLFASALGALARKGRRR